MRNELTGEKKIASVIGQLRCGGNVRDGRRTEMDERMSDKLHMLLMHYHAP